MDEGFILDKRIGVGQPKRIENAKILVANTAMDTDKIKIYGARVRVDSMAKVPSCCPSLEHLSCTYGLMQRLLTVHLCPLICKQCWNLQTLLVSACVQVSSSGMIT